MTVLNLPATQQTRELPAFPTNIFDLQRVYSTLLISYLVCAFFFYPYGFFLAGETALRVPDIFAFACVFIGGSALILKGSINAEFKALWPVLPLFALEVVLPLLGTIAGGGGAGGIANSARMFILWAPMLLFVALFGSQSANGFHKSIRKLFAFTLSINLLYSFMQILAKLSLLPQALFFKTKLEGFAIDDNFQPIISGFRADGFFANSTGLSVMGICGLAYFLGAHYGGQKGRNLFFVIISCVIILITLSRAALAAMILIILSYMLFTGTKRALKFLVQFGILTAVILFLIGRYIGFELILSRVDVFLTLGVSGALQDYSFQTRLYGIWPAVLQEIRHYPFGTLVSPISRTGVIDSGYLTYYAQGKWVFLAAVSTLLISLIWQGIGCLLSKNKNGARFSLFLLGIFLTGAMVISAPTRISFIPILLVYLFWMGKKTEDIQVQANQDEHSQV